MTPRDEGPTLVPLLEFQAIRHSDVFLISGHDNALSVRKAVSIRFAEVSLLSLLREYYFSC